MIRLLKLATVRMFVIASVAIFVPYSMAVFSVIVAFAICLASRTTKSSETGTAAKQTNDNFHEYVKAKQTPMMNVDSDCKTALRGKPIA